MTADEIIAMDSPDCLDSPDSPDSRTAPGDAPESVRQLTVSKEDEGRRLDVFLDRQLPDFTRSYLQKLIEDGQVRILRTDATEEAPRKCGRKVRCDESVIVTVPAVREPDILPEDIPLDILYEDADLIVVNKPKDMVVHPAAGHYSGTLVNALLYHCRDQLSGINGVMRPGIVHRIDKDTTGALVVCKNDKAHESLAAQLKVHSITRRYRAIVHGNLREDTGTVDAPIGRHKTDRKKMAIDRSGGRPAITHYRVLERFGRYTYIECELETGRTHQIRVHMASLGHPVLGDAVYGPARCPFPALQGQTLHAMVLGFIHPRSGEYMEFTAPLPAYFEELLEKLRASL